MKSITQYAILVLLATIFFTGCENSPTPPLTTIKMAITMDDIPIRDLVVAKKIISVFKKHNFPEVYGFVNGKKMYKDGKIEEESYSVLLNWVHLSGYPLGNHTFFHRSVRSVSTKTILEDINRNEEILESISKNIAKIDYKVFRYPFLDEGYDYKQGNSTRNYLLLNDYKIAHVSLNVADWIWADAYERCKKNNDTDHVEYIKREFLSYSVELLKHRTELAKELTGHNMSHILLLHMSKFVSEVLDELIIEFKNQGVRFIGLHEAMSGEPYAGYQDVVLPKGADILDKIFKYKIINKRNPNISLQNIQNAPRLPKTLKGLCNSN